MTGTSYDYVAADYCVANNILVCNTPGYTGAAVAEHAVALMLTSAKRIGELQTSFDADVLTSADSGIEFDCKTAGIIGLGEIGRRVAVMTQSLGMHVVYANRSSKEMIGAHQVSLRELLQVSDVVLLTLPLTESQRHLIDASAFATMKRSALPINVSSEDLVDRQALINALRAREIAGSALDIPSPDELYRGVPRLIVTPARGWYTQEGIHRRASVWIKTLSAVLDGKPKNIVVAVG